MRTRYWFAFVGMIAVALPFLLMGASHSKEPAADAAVLVKVYALTDLVAPLRVKPGAMACASLAEWSAGLPSEANEQLARLENVLRLALPNESWEEGNGPGIIASYPEKLSLIIRQTESGHRAVENLLKELRKGDDFKIELQVEMVTFENVKDEDEVFKYLRKLKLGRPVTAEELADLRKHLSSKFTEFVCVGNGRTVVGGGLLRNMSPRFTAIAALDRSSIELRLDSISDNARDGKFSWTTQVQTIPVGKTVSTLVAGGPGDGGAYLITPQIVPRSRH